jgi:hypothetical protein
MPGSYPRTTMRCMSSYAVFWRNGGIAFHGRLELDLHGLWLHGGEPGHELQVDVPFDDIVGVERDAQTAIGSCQAIRVQTRHAGNLLIASSGGSGSLGEIQETVCGAIGG